MKTSKLSHCVWIYKKHYLSSKQKLFYIYGKWTEYIKCTDYASYEVYMKETSSKSTDPRSKSPNDSPSHTSRKMLQKFNSLKVSTFKSQNSTQEVTIRTNKKTQLN